jgi:lipooligosaccharide transport system permease protein
MWYWAYAFRRLWRGSVATNFFYPVLYLAAMGVGLGSLIDHHVHTVAGVTYLHFIGPGLLAGSVMQVSVNESTYPVMSGIKWDKTHYAMLATPLTVKDIVRGHLAWICVRIAIVSTVFLCVLSGFGIVSSWWALLALPAAILLSLGIAAPVMAFAATQENEVGFNALYRLGVIPLFLFSGTFYPITLLPGWLHPVAYATPLYHGVDLERGLVLGRIGVAGPLEDLLYLSFFAVLGYLLSVRNFEKRLVI